MRELAEILASYYADCALLRGWPGACDRILHMDMRPANLLTQDGKILAVVDWSNALLGDPAAPGRPSDGAMLMVEEPPASFG